MQHWEFFHDPLYGLGSHKDDEGRPIGERNASPEALENVPLVLRECPYRDSRFRHELPMNVSALKQVSQHWYTVLSDVQALRNEYFRHYPLASPDMLHLWKLTRMITALPAYLTRRRHGQFMSGHIPAEIAVLYKVVLGVYQTFDVMMIQATFAGYDLHMQVTPASMIRLVEAQKLFVSPHGVCAGPMDMVGEILSVVINGNDKAENSSETKELIGPIHAFFEYCSLETMLHLSKYIYLVNSFNMAEQYFRSVAALGQGRETKNDGVGGLLEKLSELAEDYQPSSKITEILKQTSREFRDRLLTNLFTLVNSYSYEQLQRDCSRLLQRSADALTREEEVALVQPLVAMKKANSDAADAHVWEALLHPLAQYVVYERGALKAFTMLQSAVDVSLGYEKSSTPVDSAHLKMAFGQTLATLAGEAFGVSFMNYSDQTIMHYE